VTYTYDNLGRRTLDARGNGSTMSYGWDGVSRLASLNLNASGGAAYDNTVTFSYNPAGQITQRLWVRG
jgi:hypothetical protein